MGSINMGLVHENLSSAALILTHFHGDLYQQVYIDSSVTCRGRLQEAGAKFMQPTEALPMVPAPRQLLKVGNRFVPFLLGLVRLENFTAKRSKMY